MSDKKEKQHLENTWKAFGRTWKDLESAWKSLGRTWEVLGKYLENQLIEKVMSCKLCTYRHISQKVQP